MRQGSTTRWLLFCGTLLQVEEPLLLSWEHRLHLGPLPAYDEKYALTVAVLIQFAGSFPGKWGHWIIYH